MKIAFLGNTNNYHFMVAQAAARLGHEVTLYIDSEEPLHDPQAYRDETASDTVVVRSIAGLIDHFHEYLWGSRKVKAFKSELAGFDALFSTGMWNIVARAVRKPYVVLITGSDLEIGASPRAIVSRFWKESGQRNIVSRCLRASILAIVAGAQARAISHSRAFNYFPKGIIPVGDKLLENAQRFGAQRFAIMMTDTHRFSPLPPADNPVPRVLLAARQTWKKPYRPGCTSLDYKGTDILLRGVQVFRERTGLPLQLVLVKKGQDIEHTLALVDELKIADCIEWLPEMSQKELFQQFRLADIIADQFDQSVVGMAGLDAMAMGRPLLANGRPEIFQPLIGVESAICQAQTPEEVCQQLQNLYEPAARAEVARRGRDYVEQYFSADHGAQVFCEVLSAARKA